VAPTPPLLPNNRPIKERILIYGPPKIGKTHQFFQIARWHQDLGSDAKFYGISTDTSFEVLYMNPQFCDLTNIEWTDVVQFQDYVDAARRYTGLMTPQDWLSVDLMDDAWAAVQDEYARATAKGAGVEIEDMGDLWVASGPDIADPKKTDDRYPVGGWEWGMPNARYRILANNYLLRAPGNLMLVCGQKELMKTSGSGKSGESKESLEMFGHIGLKPAGQKGDPFRYHTILHISGNGEKRQKMSTAGERWGARRWWGKKMTGGQVRDEPFEDFFVDYLVKTAGWEM
jgi:hypothetical protein